MKSDTNWLSNLKKEYNHNFKSGGILFRSFHDLLWQIAINGMLEDEKDPVIFHVDVTAKNGNELILAFSSGGYKKTGVYFVNEDYSKCCDIAEEINEKFFQIDKDEQMELMAKSMTHDFN